MTYPDGYANMTANGRRGSVRARGWRPMPMAPPIPKTASPQACATARASLVRGQGWVHLCGRLEGRGDGGARCMATFATAAMSMRAGSWPGKREGQGKLTYKEGPDQRGYLEKGACCAARPLHPRRHLRRPAARCRTEPARHAPRAPAFGSVHADPGQMAILPNQHRLGCRHRAQHRQVPGPFGRGPLQRHPIWPSFLKLF